MNKKKPTVLVILDGFGYRAETKYNAIAHADTPNIDKWFTQYPNTTLQAAGTAVGLLEGIIGNSEVGHLTIGAGRIIKQPISQIHNAIDNKTFFKNQVLTKNLTTLQQKNGTLHIMGLLSDAGVHSHEKHLQAFLEAAKDHDIRKVFVHLFLDGRDVPPKTAKIYVQRLENVLKKMGIGAIGSIHGRFYAMDRDKNWERTEQTYRVLTEKKPIKFNTWQKALDYYYAQDITDEFVPPTQLDTQEYIKKNDGIVFFNFRPDRARQLTQAFVDPHFTAFNTHSIPLTFFITPVAYNAYANVDVMFKTPEIRNTVKEVLSKAGKTIFTIAETEKYAHVTYFFSGGREQPFQGETQLLIPSIAAKNYIDNPKMSAHEITQAVLYSLQTNPCDFYLINYANADMVAHSGNFDATVKAIEYLDHELKKIYDQVVTHMDGTMYITADHGNAEEMFDPIAHQPRTAHTNNPVPFIMINNKVKNVPIKLSLKQLSDIAPFVLKNAELKVPEEM